jgi:hypothetical protein
MTAGVAAVAASQRICTGTLHLAATATTPGVTSEDSTPVRGRYEAVRMIMHALRTLDTIQMLDQGIRRRGSRELLPPLLSLMAGTHQHTPGRWWCRCWKDTLK